MSPLSLVRDDFPAKLELMRHAQSAYNSFRGQRDSIAGYGDLRDRVAADRKDPDFELQVRLRRWPSPELVEIAVSVHRAIREIMPFSDEQTPLTDEGKRRAREVGEELASLEPDLPDAVYVSPYLRTRQTLEQVLRGWPALASVPARIDARLREQDHGKSGQLKIPELLFVFHPEEIAHSEETGMYAYRHLNGENTYDVLDRAAGFLDHLSVAHPGRSVFAVTHDRTILAMRSVLEGWDPQRHAREMRNGAPKEASVTRYYTQPASIKPWTGEVEVFAPGLLVGSAI